VVLIVNASSLNKTVTVKGLEENCADGYITSAAKDIEQISAKAGFS
jgi:hypothetical protein